MNGISSLFCPVYHLCSVHFGPHTSLPQYPLRIKRMLSCNYYMLMTPGANPGGSRRFDGYRLQGSRFESRCRNECSSLVFVVKAATSATCLSLVPRRNAGCVCVSDINQNKQATCAPDGPLRHSKETENPHD